MRLKPGTTVLRVLFIVALASLSLPGALVSTARAAGPNVTLQDNSADIDTFQALNQTDTQSRSKTRDNFFAFAENLLPPDLKGVEGTAKVFAQQASVMVTPAQPPFPITPLNAIGLSGRVRSKATKNNNSAPGVPVADSHGSLSVDFTTSGDTPFQFDGALLATNQDP